MVLHVSIYDDKEINTKSEDFKKLISDAVREIILRDWDKIAKIEKHEELNNSKKEYLVNVEFRYE
jgi:hypothetical protein